MLIYKVLRPAEWRELESRGESPGSPADRADGYVHFSTAAQLEGTLARHYRAERALVLAALDPDALGPALRWEPARDGSLFPHLYRPLARADVIWTRPLADGPDGPLAPPDLA